MIGADGITLDLNRHTISRPGRTVGSGRGVLNIGFDDVMIRIIARNTAFGIALGQATTSRVARVLASGNGQGITIQGGSGNVVRSNVASRNDHGDARRAERGGRQRGS